MIRCDFCEEKAVTIISRLGEKDGRRFFCPSHRAELDTVDANGRTNNGKLWASPLPGRSQLSELSFEEISAILRTQRG